MSSIVVFRTLDNLLRYIPPDLRGTMENFTLFFFNLINVSANSFSFLLFLKNVVFYALLRFYTKISYSFNSKRQFLKR